MMQSAAGDDPWMNVQSGTFVDDAPRRPYLQIETIDNVEPLDAQIGAVVKKTVPDSLHDALFGQPEPSSAEIEAAGGDPAAVPPIQTYAILDAAKVTNLPELLEDSELEHRCLFKGAAYDDLKNVAPWIVRLEGGNTFTRNLFTRSDAYWHLWDNEPGLYVRSRATLDDLWRHFRKFTRVQDEAGNWLYFRFWEAQIFPEYFHRTAHRPQNLPFFQAAGFPLSICYVAGEVSTVITKKIGAMTATPFSLNIQTMSRISAEILSIRTCQYVGMRFDTGHLDNYDLEHMDSTDIQICALLYGAYGAQITYRWNANMTRLQKDRITRKLRFAIYQRIDLQEARF